MALVACPKCATNLKVPDGSAAAVRCPKCKTVFKPPAPQPAFEVVDESEPKAPANKAASSEADESPTPPPKKRVVAQEDDGDDEPTSRRSRDDEDDDDEDDRPRKKQRRDDDDDDDEEDDRPRKPKARRRVVSSDSGAEAFGRARTGAMLLGIAFWLYLGTLGLLTLFLILGWAGARLPDWLLVVPGLAGLGNWLVAAVGLAFALAGPPQARGLALAATIAAGVHFTLVVICASESRTGDLLWVGVGGGPGSIDWRAFSGQLVEFDQLLTHLFYNSKQFSYLVWGLVAGAAEVARFVLLMLTLKALADAAGDGAAGDRCRYGLAIGVIVTGAAVLVHLLLAVIFREGGFTNVRTLVNVAMGVGVLMYLAHALSMLMPAVAANETKNGLDARS